MATRIRLARGGRKKAPFYRIVVADSRSPRDGRFIERIGTFDPLRSENNITLNTERAKHWLDVGAQPSDRVIKIMKIQGLEHNAFAALLFQEAKEKPAAPQAEAAAAAPAAEAPTPATEAAPAEPAPVEAPPAPEAAPAEEAPAAEAAPVEAKVEEAAPAEAAPAEAPEKEKSAE